MVFRGPIVEGKEVAMRRKVAQIAAALCALVGCTSVKEPGRAVSGEAEPSILGYEMARLDGGVENLDAYKGRVVLVVNVASKCGLTPQYAGLERLYREREARGFVVLGFPANDFAGQEPGSDEEIAAFCEASYGVTFPMFSKISVKGEGAHPLYRELARVGGEPDWNFTKYLVDRSGRVVARFGPRTKPEDAELVTRIDALLGG